MKTKKKETFYYILAGTKDFKEKLSNAGIHNYDDDMLVVKWNSEIGRLVRKKVNAKIIESAKNND